jgi:hypothetical protein
MKKLLLLAVTFVSIFATKAQTADEVINKFLVASGGKENLQAINSLQYTQSMTLNTPMGAIPVKMEFFKVEKKLFRLNTSSEMFGDGFSVVTDTSGWVLIPANPFAGSTEPTLKKLKPEERTGFASQMNADGFFPELVNYAAKGFTAELAGEAKANGKPCYKIKLKKDKAEITFLIDKQTNLVSSMTLKGASAMAMSGMGGSGIGSEGRADKLELTFNYSNYQTINGVKFPGTMKLDTPMMGTIESSITGVKVNQPVDAKWYRPQ